MSLSARLGKLVGPFPPGARPPPGKPPVPAAPPPEDPAARTPLDRHAPGAVRAPPPVAPACGRHPVFIRLG